MNDWLRDWCRAQGFGFYDHGRAFEEVGMLTPDGAQLSRWGKNVLCSKLSRLSRKALNYMWWGKGIHF